MSAGAPEPPGPPDEVTQPTERLRAPLPPRQPLDPPVAPRVVERVPALAPEDPWWSNPWVALLAAVVGLLLGGVVGYALGHNGRSSEAGAGGTSAATRTVTSTRTVVQPKVVVHTVTASTVTQTPANPASEQRRLEAEAKASKLEKENEELRAQGEPAG
jgi:hypothetical protein